MKGKKYLVTGGCGFIGSAFIRNILEDDNIICNIDKLSYSSSIESIKIDDQKNYNFSKVDLFDADATDLTIKEFEPDYVIHFAAETHVDRSIDGPLEFINSNIIGTFNLLNSCLKYWQQLENKKKLEFRFIHVSTDEVYGALDYNDKPFDEKSPYLPNSPYSASKASSDHLVRSWNKTYSFPTIITNTCNNYGPWQFPEKLIPLTINKCLGKKKIPIYGDGKQIRDWIYVDDHIEGIKKIIQKGIIGENYTIGSHCELTNFEVVTTICDLLDELKPDANNVYRNLIEYVEDRPGHDKRYAINSDKVRSLGWNPIFTWKDGIEKTIKWYLDNSDFLESKNRQVYSGERLGKL
tara:strand:- start:7391 stop:8443 length:1053 start_codon:yes stop_codon:yes gene_type:complete